MSGQRTRLPGHQFGPLAQEAARGETRQQRARLFLGHPVVAQQALRAGAAGGDALVLLRRTLHAGAQHHRGGGMQVGEQTRLPFRPKLRVGARDVGHGEHVEVVQVLAVDHLYGEAMHDIGVADVLPLRGRAHQQVPAHQPRDHCDIGRRQPEPLAEGARLHLAFHRMIAAAPLGDVVEQRRQQDALGPPCRLEQIRGQRELRTRRGVGETSDVAQHANRVLVHGVGMEQVVLHASDDAPERGQQRGEHAVPVHPRQHLHGGRTAPQQREERIEHVRIVGEGLAMAQQRLLRQPHRLRRKTGHSWRVDLRGEQVDQRARPAQQQVRVSQLDARPAHHEIRPQCARRQGRFETLRAAFQQLRADASDDGRGAVVRLHELLDREIGGIAILVAELDGQPGLVVEQQPFLRATGKPVQREAAAPQRPLRAQQCVTFGVVQQPDADHRLEVRRAGHAPPEPAHQVQRAQAARAVLEVGLEVVGGVVEPREASRLLRAFGFDERGRRPQRRIGEEVRQRIGQRRVAGDASRIEQRGEHAEVVPGKRATLRRRANGLPRPQTDVPQAREERLQRAFLPRQCIGLAERQQVDVRMREQHAPPETADREQRASAGVADARLPDMTDHGLDRVRAQGDQRADIAAWTEGQLDRAVGILQQLAQRTPGIG